MSTSIDKEIGEIRVALRDVKDTIYKISLQMENATLIVGGKLDNVDEEVNRVAREVTHIRDNTNSVTSLFPSRSTYLGAFLALDAIIWILAVFLLYKIVINLRGAGKTSQKWQTKYGPLQREFSKPATVIIVDSQNSEDAADSVIVKINPQPRAIREPPPYRPSLGRGHYNRRNGGGFSTPPSKNSRHDDEASSLLNEIPLDRRDEWTQVIDER